MWFDGLFGRGYKFIDNCLLLWIDENKVYLTSGSLVMLTDKLRAFGHEHEFEF